MTEFFSPFSPHFYDYSEHGCTDEDGKDVTAQDWFGLCIAGTYKDIADRFGCACKVSGTEINNARVHWMRDVQALKIEGGGRPDHFKQAGILSYWLRRRLPVRELRTTGKRDTEVGRDRQATFMRFSHELAAFMFGFELCRYAECRAALSSGTSAVTAIRAIKPDFDFAKDACILMRNKHISPHSLMMIYRALLKDPKA